MIEYLSTSGSSGLSGVRRGLRRTRVPKGALKVPVEGVVRPVGILAIPKKRAALAPNDERFRRQRPKKWRRPRCPPRGKADPYEGLAGGVRTKAVFPIVP